MKRLAFLIAWLVGLNGCGPDFDAFNLLNKLRVLAVRADPPWVAEGQQTTLDALVYHPDNAPVRYRWSWCPFTAEANAGFECLIDEVELQQAAASLPPAQQFTVPPFDLGDATSVTFDYLGTAAFLRAACDALLGQEVPDFVIPPTCDEGLEIQFRLTVQAGNEEVIAVKNVMFSFDANRVHRNPTLGGLKISRDNRESRAVELTDPPIGSVPYARATRLFVDIPTTASELFTPFPTANEPDPVARLETLTVTWFIEGGETDSIRTSFIDGEVPLDDTRTNEWTTPTAQEFPRNVARIFAVIRDERLGTGWTEGTIGLGEP